MKKLMIGMCIAVMAVFASCAATKSKSNTPAMAQPTPYDNNPNEDK